jgi:hypothetical protein
VDLVGGASERYLIKIFLAVCINQIFLGVWCDREIYQVCSLKEDMRAMFHD